MTEFLFGIKDVKALRTAVKLTQQQAAESLQLKSSSSWRDWESGRHQMTKGHVEYFCLKNNLSFDQVLIDSGNSLPN